jgi:hypothetical protein
MSALSFSPRSPRPQGELQDLLVRMRQRLYPETTPVLASCWLNTVYSRGHDRGWWKELNELLREALDQEDLNAASREALSDIRTWIQQSVLPAGKIPSPPPERQEPLRNSLGPERLRPYIARLLNEWLSAEIAHLLIDEAEAGSTQDGGIPVLAAGKALERLLVREHLSRQTLELLLSPELLSPQYVYPADAEMLTDVVLNLLGRTGAPVPPILPATPLIVPKGSPLPPDYPEAVRRACLVQNETGDEVHVSITGAQALEILKDAPLRIASVIVTMDGRWWESVSLRTGDQNFVVYKPGGRLRIDHSADHAKLEVPWPDTQLYWPGAVHLQDPFEVFGREWHASNLETDENGTRLHLVFSRVLPLAQIHPAVDADLRRSHPASVDMAWAALENALDEAIHQKSLDPVEQLRRGDFIPLGRAMFALAESIKGHRTVSRETLETQLRAIRYLESTISVEYGRVPWKVLPDPVRQAFLKKRLDPGLLQLLNQVFDGLPQPLNVATSPGTPSQAA